MKRGLKIFLIILFFGGLFTIIQYNFTGNVIDSGGVPVYYPSDSDLGKNYFEKGYCQDVKGKWVEDWCGVVGTKWEGTLAEYYLNASGGCVQDLHKCANGCLNASCLGKTDSSENILNALGTNSIYTRGRCVDGKITSWGYAEDYCGDVGTQWEGTLVEYIFVNGACKQSSVKCEKGCMFGRCLKGEQVSICKDCVFSIGLPEQCRRFISENDKFLDVYIKNIDSVSKEVHFYILTEEKISGYIPLPTEQRVRDLEPGEFTGFHIDLSEYKNSWVCPYLSSGYFYWPGYPLNNTNIIESSLDNRNTLFPEGLNYKSTEWLNKFESEKGKKLGISSIGGNPHWWSGSYQSTTAKNMEALYYRPMISPEILNVLECNTKSPQKCFKPSVWVWDSFRSLSQTDSMIEGYFYRGVPIVGVFQGPVFGDVVIKDSSDFKNLFNYQGPYYHEGQYTSYKNLDLDYQRYRLDTKNQFLVYGLNEWLFNRYKNAIIAVEPGNEQNWHTPHMRADNSVAGERDWAVKESQKFFKYMCEIAKRNGKLCIVPSTIDFSAPVTYEGALSGYDFLSTYKNSQYGDLLANADYGNVHFYKNVADMENQINTVMSGGGYNPGLANLMPGKKWIISEFGYESVGGVEANPNLIQWMKGYIKNNNLFAGASYWGDIEIWWMQFSPVYQSTSKASIFKLDKIEVIPSECNNQCTDPLTGMCYKRSPFYLRYNCGGGHLGGDGSRAGIGDTWSPNEPFYSQFKA